MYLKSIEVQGFKSFANKILFEFHNGITGIVGPNGSGKSNVADAVRWVLGEQSAKQLRGAKMEDIIFAGTELRKPVSYAYVSITFDNTDRALNMDYDEVTVTRKVFRSGESNYQINGNVCRLKDINELFYDTGIGKEGYSIIGQGQIDRILSGKAEERRELFDEAAGIVKFKRRKNESLKRLESEEANLVRINDVLTELEKQVGPLEKQSKKAKEYLYLKDELKKYDVNQFLLETKKNELQINEISTKSENANNELNRLNNEFEDIKVKYDTIEAEIEIVNESIDIYTAKQNEATVDKGRLEGEINVLKEQINTLLVNDKHIAERTEVINKEILAKTNEKEVHNKKIEEFNASKLELQEKLDQYGDGHKALADKIAECTRAVEETNARILEAINNKGQANSKAERYKATLEAAMIRKAELTGKILRGKTDEEAINKKVTEYQQALSNVALEIENLNKNNDEYSSERTSKRELSDELTNEVNKLTQQYHSQKSKLESLKNITERYEGYGSSIKKVMELKSTNEGILGVIADIVKVDKRYEVAIETALGGTIQNIVTDTEDTAKSLIQYLKDNKFGRATFLPLSAISGRNTLKNDPCVKEKGVVGIASDLVRVSFEYEELSKYLLGRVLVVDNIDNALSIARKYKYSLRIVTIEGEQLNPGGSMTGGAFKNTSNLLGRRREIEELEISVKEYSKTISEKQEEIKKLRARLTELRELIDENNKALRNKSVELNTAQMNYRQAADKKKEITNSYSDLSGELASQEKQIAEIEDELAGTKDLIKELEELITNSRSALVNNQELLEAAKKDESEYNQDSDSLRYKIQSIIQNIGFENDNIARLDGEIANLNKELEEIGNKVGETKQEISQKKLEISSIELRIKDTKNSLEEFVAKTNEMKALRDEKNTSHKSFFEHREKLQRQITELEKECYRLTTQLEKVNENNDGLFAYMWSEYEITLSIAETMKDDSLTDLNDIKKNINSLKLSIKNLGDVNVNAIEDYREVSERYEFLKTQHEDLVNSKNTLLGIIEELDTGMRKQFTEKFEEIKVEFDKVFKELFGGGKGNIELEEGDVLEAGIKIISQPPGKKLQNMMQMSGGEKALTAISLLFAIQNLKPSPFCLLDEIEAALDDSNVTRYAQYLHKLTKYTQFIVITHRRGTMNAADRLYGITMQEKGVSTLVSVDLIEKDLEKDNKKE